MVADSPERRMPLALQAARTVLSEPSLLRLQLAWLSVHAGKAALLVGNLLLAYEIGGAAAMGAFGLARFLTPTVISLFVGLPTARWAPHRVLVTVNALRCVSVLLILLTVVASLPIEAFYLAVALEGGVGAFSRPLHAAILPFVSRTPAGLVAANVTSSAVEGIGTFVGPAIAGVVLVASGTAAVHLAVTAIYALGVVAIAFLPERTTRPDVVPVTLAAARRQAVAGLLTFVHVRGPRLVLTGIFLQTLVRGLLNVLLVLTAVELLGLGQGGVGSLNALLGAGGLLGAGVALALAGQRGLATPYALSLASWGAPLLVVGLIAHPLVAVLAMLAIGMANSVVDVTAYTLLQRTTQNRDRVAVMGLLDSLANGGQALGALLAPALVIALGTNGALLVAGAILPIGALLLLPGLRASDPGVRGDDELPALLRSVPLFAPLSLAAIEDVVSQLRPVAYGSGDWLMREGEPGHEYVIVGSGSIEVSQGGTPIRILGRGGAVGEIALLQDVPRTASVQALEPVSAYSLAREDFLQALTAGPAAGT